MLTPTVREIRRLSPHHPVRTAPAVATPAVADPLQPAVVRVAPTATA